MFEKKSRPIPKYQPIVDKLGKRYIEGMNISDRGVDLYSEDLGINLKEMKGKKVLDLGSSHTERFSKEAAELGITVYSVGPHLKEGASPNADFKENWQGLSSAGVAQAIPFIENSFDYVVAYSSVPMYSPFNMEEYKKWISEVIRVLKPKGTAHFYPVSEEYRDLIFDVLGDMPSVDAPPSVTEIKDFIAFPFPEGTKLYRLVFTKRKA